MKKIIIFLIIIQFLSLGFLSLHNELYTWDEASYIINGKELSGELTNPVMKEYVAHERHPLLSWMIAGLLILHVPFFVIKLLSLLSLLLFFILVYKMGKEFYGEDVGLLAGFILTTIPTVIILSSKVLTDVSGALLFSFSLYLYYKGIEKPRYFLYGGFIGAASIMMRDMNILLAPILIIFGVIFFKKMNKKYFLLSVPIAGLTLLPYFIDNYLRWGNPLARIFMHITMVQQGIGYDAFSFLNSPILWIIFLPLFVGIPLFVFFLIRIYKQRKMVGHEPRLTFLILWFLIPFVLFILNQKISPRLIPIYLVPILLLGACEILSRSQKYLKLGLMLILSVNLFLVFNVVAYQYISLSDSHQEVFETVTLHLSENETVYTNGSPPSVIALHTNRRTEFNLNPDGNKTVGYYLFDKTYEDYTHRTTLTPTQYTTLFENEVYVFYKKLED